MHACVRKTRLDRIERGGRGEFAKYSSVAGLTTNISIRSDTNSRGCGRTSERPRNSRKQDELAALGKADGEQSDCKAAPML
jgi:hypothetical protein